MLIFLLFFHQQQADDWAKKKKDYLEQERQKLLNKQFVAGDQVCSLLTFFFKGVQLLRA